MSGEAVRVLMVGPSLDILGGQAVQAARLREALSKRGTLVLAFVAVNPRLPGVLARLQRIRYLRTVVTELAYGLALLAALPEADVVHVYSASYWSFLLAPVPALLLARLLGKPVILNYHSGEAEDHLARWGWHAIPLLRLSQRIVVQTPYLQRVFARHGLDAAVIPNSLEPAAFGFRPRKSPLPRFITNRNHEAHYGVPTVLRAFALIQAELPGSSLSVIGSGSQTAALRELAGALELRNVEWAGMVPMGAMPAHYDRADVFLNGSEIDNMPLSILEAFAAGLPVVSTDAGGIPLLVEHDRTGLLVPTGNHAAMARAALRLFREEGLAPRLADAAHRKVVAEFSDQSVGKAWEAAYIELASRS